ncbi:MAG: N-acetylmuramic acid 6-phosphate etherase [Sulfobacillus benefaciens]|uniref:N-acetylmuramic acid 6-phosphate etherase n=1 Tax=Sulfobacillus benefaciens TaxID=453960 RepID=A0A2T2XD22_9FIRM|nr:MAG: N-acetylmuramic acid 6-phosphate etherase [Sulfobacillus benefaciens]
MHRLATETGTTEVPMLEQLSTTKLLQLINAHDQTVALRVAEKLAVIAEAVDKISANMAVGGRLIYVGAGTSGRLGVLDAAECPPTFGVDYETVVGVIAGGDQAIRCAVEDAEDDEELGHQEMIAMNLREHDTVVGISASGRTPYVLGALRMARGLKVLTIALSNNKDSEIGRLASLAIEVETGPEILVGSTRMKAGTAQKMVLNMLSTAVMIRQGKTYQNLMVDMRPSNQKLVDRAKRMVAVACDCNYRRAEQLFEQAQGNVKIAVIMGRGKVEYAHAKNLLEACGGSVYQALHRL